MNLIQEYVRAVLQEAAVQNISDMGLLIDSSGPIINFVLYDINKFIEESKKNKKLTFSNDMINGMIRAKKGGFGNCHGAWEIAFVAANKGYGPTMYDIAMSTVPSRTIMPDRAEVSSQAKSVWKYYKDNRSDVEAIPFDSSENEEGEGECSSFHYGPSKEYLDYAYRLTGPPAVDASQAIGNHKKLVIDLNNKKEGLGTSFSNSLKAGSINFFKGKVS